MRLWDMIDTVVGNRTLFAQLNQAIQLLGDLITARIWGNGERRYMYTSVIEYDTERVCFKNPISLGYLDMYYKLFVFCIVLTV